MPSPILARADALMHRRRPAGGEADDIPILTDTVEDDIPVLVDSEPASPPSSVPPEAPDEPTAQELIIRELARRVEQRLRDELPRIIETAVSDFLAERSMIDPPPSA